MVSLSSTAAAKSAELQHEAVQALHHTVDACQLPAWMQKDVHITRGYRVQNNSFRRCYDSLWYLHNETVNIWSHLLIGICFLSLLLWSALPALHGQYAFSSSDLRAFQAYLFGVTVCLFFSAFYHCVSCHSEHIARQCLKLDYLGIVFNISSTCVSATYFGLYHHKQLGSWYITLILICGSMTFWAVLDPKMDGPKAASLRSFIFILLGASGFAPIIHASASDDMTLANFPIRHIVVSTILYLSGTAFYVSRAPEKYWPGRFDLWGASHQIFHILVNCAQISHLVGLWIVLGKHYEDKAAKFAGIPNLP